MTTNFTSNVPACWIGGAPRDGGTEAGGGWRDYWNRLEDLEVFRIEAADYIARLEQVVDLRSRRRVLDFGCGMGYVAALLAERCTKVAVWDFSPNMRERTLRMLRERRNVEFVDLTDTAAQESLGQFDLILAHSVIQYMSRGEFQGWLARWRGALDSATGRIILSDIVTPGNRLVRDIAALVYFSARHRFLRKMLKEGVQEMRRYVSTRRDHPLQILTRSDIETLCRSSELVVEFVPNLSYRPGRLTAVIRPGAVGAHTVSAT